MSKNKLWSDHKDMKNITENFRRFTEEEETPSSNAVKLFIQGSQLGLEDFVTLLKRIASDPAFRQLAISGTRDQDGSSDEALTVSSGKPVAARDLTPTQKDIDMEKSLGDQMTNKWEPGSTVSALQKVVKMPSPGGPIPILTYDNKYILDGHHRWSQVMMTNPDGKMEVNNLSGPALPNAEVALKATQLAIAALAGKVKTKDTKTNLLTFPKEAMGEYVRKNITPEVLKLLVKYEKIQKPDVEEAAQYYMGNLAAIQDKPAGKFSRIKGMPQADESGVKQDKVNKALEQGIINFDDPSINDLDRDVLHRKNKAATGVKNTKKAFSGSSTAAGRMRHENRIRKIIKEEIKNQKTKRKE